MLLVESLILLVCIFLLKEFIDHYLLLVICILVTINPVSYLRYLEKRFLNFGGTFVKRTVDDIFDIIDEDTTVLVNCLGLEATRVVKQFENDKIYPISGQLVIAKIPLLKTCFYMHYYDKTRDLTYAVSRSDGSIALGGTRCKNQWSTEVSDDITQKIIANCQKFISVLKKEHVIKATVGLQPIRDERICLKSEFLSNKNNHKIFLVSNYDHGGTGYQTSYAYA